MVQLKLFPFTPRQILAFAFRVVWVQLAGRGGVYKICALFGDSWQGPHCGAADGTVYLLFQVAEVGIKSGSLSLES